MLLHVESECAILLITAGQCMTRQWRQSVHRGADMPDSDSQLTLYRLLVEHSLGLMCIHDCEGILIAINPAAAESLGYSSDEGAGRNLREFLSPEVRPLFDDYLARIRRNGKDSGLMRLVSRDGAERI